MMHRLSIERETLKKHRHALYAQLHVKTPIDIILAAYQSALICLLE
jgi:hypothetical protein